MPKPIDKMNFRERLAQFAEQYGATQCWPWPGGVDGNGYVPMHWGGRTGKRIRAHRLAYELLVGPIPDGLHIDHLCKVRRCCNPAHMEPVTPAENALRSPSPPTLNKAKTHCPQGHPYSVENTWISRMGWRQCRACKYERQLAYWAAHPEEYATHLRRSTHCRQGHEFTPETVTYNTNGKRRCRICSLAKQREYNRTKRPRKSHIR
jgi:hypothetical protein